MTGLGSAADFLGLPFFFPAYLMGVGAMLSCGMKFCWDSVWELASDNVAPDSFSDCWVANFLPGLEVNCFSDFLVWCPKRMKTTKLSGQNGIANSEDPDQTAPLGAV